MLGPQEVAILEQLVPSLWSLQPNFSAPCKREEGVREGAAAMAAFPSWPPTSGSHAGS